MGYLTTRLSIVQKACGVSGHFDCQWERGRGDARDPTVEREQSPVAAIK